MRASNCVTDSALSLLRISPSQAARMNACSDRKPLSIDVFLTRSRNSLLGNSKFRSVLGFDIFFLHFEMLKCWETLNKTRWHICATLSAKVATSLYVPIRVSVADNSPAFHARCPYHC